jgi:hypothetical protein
MTEGTAITAGIGVVVTVLEDCPVGKLMVCVSEVVLKDGLILNAIKV